MKRLIISSVVLCLLFSLTSCAKREETIPRTPSTVIVEAPAESSVSSASNPVTIPESTISASSTSSTSSVFSARTESPPELSETSPEPNPSTPVNEELPYKAYALYCVEDKRFIAGDGIDVHAAPASLTKLLTASVALRYVKPDEVITVGTERDLVHSGSSLCFILKGHRLKLYDLITGMLMVSGNDAAYTVAVSTARAVSGDSAMSDTEAAAYFCDLMNDLARELGMKNSHFTTPDGWDDPEQYTTAYDMALLARYALSVPEIREIVSTRQKYVVFESGENITWTNTNKLLDPESEFYSESAVGMKTGTTENAGNCLIAAFSKKGKTYISVVMGCDTDYDRYSITRERWRDISA